jgi:hypothetical protein
MATVSFGEDIPMFGSQMSENIGEKKEKVSPFDADFAKLVEITRSKWHLPGVSLAVVDGDETFAEVFIFFLRETILTKQPNTIKRDTALLPYQMSLSAHRLSFAQEALQSHLLQPLLHS